jgi:predicted CXXCH cytochrome family protein
MGLPSLFLCLTLLGFPQSQSKEHPVPLPADFNPANCVQCHADKQQGKYVHTAITSIGCTACHQIETKNDTTAISLAAPTSQLCLTCHEASKGEDVHKPYADHECVFCHSPHASDFPAHIRLAINPLCLECHGDRRATDKVEIFSKFTLSEDEFSQIPKIILDKREQFGHPFLGHPVSGGPDPLRKGEEFSCLSCHEPHVAPLPKLLQAQFKGLAVCDNCHQAAEALKARKVEPAPKPESTQKPRKDKP